MTKAYYSSEVDKLLGKIDYSKLGKNVAIKVHFGERGCVTYMDPKIVKKVYDKIISLGKKATLVECNVLYKGSRTNALDHIATAKEHGFGFAPIDILDGEDGSEFVEIEGCKIGKGIKKYDSLVVISHFKGHSLAGFGAAIKNVGMGLGSRAGKMHMHINTHPKISEKCIACGKCIKHCDVNAIKVVNGKAKIDTKKCIGCAMCVAVCPEGAVSVPWLEETPGELQKKIAKYAKAVLSLFRKPIFINILEKVTEECDCYDYVQKPIMADMGLVYSEDIVAVDKASLDLANKHSEGKFDKINEVDKNNQILFAEEMGLGSSKYDLIKV